ncbi:hypothetical protein LZ30DRAFT_316869 [Colletotrichum cereale]|nr:hypothetical protein LZ30DRAFT_316869 [Colletotrichum cereale]
MGYLSRTAQSSWYSWPSTKAPLYSVSVGLLFGHQLHSVSRLCLFWKHHHLLGSFNARFPFFLLDNRERPRILLT